jgi:hypothetical protein
MNSPRERLPVDFCQLSKRILQFEQARDRDPELLIENLNELRQCFLLASA